MKNYDKATVKCAKQFTQKKINLLFCKLKTLDILQLTHFQSAGFTKKNMGQINAGTNR